jgi:hypothetical protein
MTGMRFDADGTMRMTELFGPSTLDLWETSYDLLANALIMLGAINLGPLAAYRKMIGDYVRRYGSSVWHVVYQADSRMRLEQMERLHRKASQAKAKAIRAGGDTDFKPDRPWDYVWSAAVADSGFWKEELEEVALLLINRKIPGKASEDAAIATNNLISEVARGSELRDYQQQGGHGQPPAKRAKKEKNAGHHIENGLYTANRASRSLCPEYNEGTCRNTVRGMFCGKNTDMVHQCNKCLGNHPGHGCQKTEHQAPARHRSGKGKSKKGSGKGK